MQNPIDYAMGENPDEMAKAHFPTFDQLQQRAAAGLPVTDEMIRQARLRIDCCDGGVLTEAEQDDSLYTRLSRLAGDWLPRS